VAKTLLNCVNEIFKRVNNIAGDAAALTTLVDSARQHPIDVSIQVINEGIDELYSYTQEGLPKQQAETTITLATNTREYALASDLIRLHYPMVDRTNTQYISEFPGGYDAMLLWDIQQTFTGLPMYGCISPITGLLRVERAPTAAENGRIYTYEYEKDLGLVNATDTVPFSNAVFRSMVPMWVQLYKREMQGEFDEALYKAGIGRASRFLSELEPRPSYSPRPTSTSALDPFESR
jgi:hypothetical protein